ncbi:MAG: hypothetical protein GXP44_01610 [bacterium]|nr:hypothetical protein [bacterium]
MIKLIIFTIAVIIILSYFNISLRAIIDGNAFQDNFSFVWNSVKSGWNKYLVGPADYLWNDIFIDLIWDSFTDNLEKIKNGDDTTLTESAPAANFK